MDCVVCQSSNETKSCSRCKTVYYCSVAHQKQHWSIHKPDCGLFRVVDSGDPTRGKYCVANRDLQAGEIILEEKAAFYSSWFTQPSTCVACGMHFNDSTAAGSCSKCDCTVCGPACEESPVHSENECPLFARNKRIVEILKRFAVDSSTMFLMIRGAALKAKQPKVFKQVMQLQHTSTCEFFQKKTDAIVAKFLLGLKPTVSTGSGTNSGIEIYQRIGSVALMNMFRDVMLVSSTPSVDQKVEGSDDARDLKKENNARDDGANKGRCCVYVRASRFNHSCIPNCSWIIGPEPECRIRVLAAVPINKGEEITICYSGAQTDLVTHGTHERQKLLKSDCGVYCKCPRCTDPTELGTYSSAVTCVACKNRLNENGETDCTKYGYMLAENPLDASAYALWKCTICGKKLKNFEVLGLIDCIQTELTSKFCPGPEEPPEGAEETNDLRLFEETMEKFRGNVLHPNHILIAKTVGAICSSLECEIVQDDAPPLSVIERHLGWINYVLAISDKIFPGLCSIRAHLLSILADILRTKIDNFGLDLPADELTRDYNLYMRTSWESFQFFKLDFCSSGEQMNYTARNILLNIDNMKANWGDEVLSEDDDVNEILGLIKQYSEVLNRLQV